MIKTEVGVGVGVGVGSEGLGGEGIPPTPTLTPTPTPAPGLRLAGTLAPPGNPPEIPVLGIPHYNQVKYLERCLRSIDYPVDRLVVIDNSNGCSGELDVLGRRFVNVVTHPNAGVAGSWNEIIKLFPAPWWLIINDDIEFAPGDLRKMAGFVAHAMEPTPGDPLALSSPGCIYGNHGASWFALTAGCVARVGLFDENIFPAYLEDCDYSRRCDLLGVRRCDVPEVHAIHGDGHNGSCTVNANPELARANARTHGGNFDYYRRKWGGLNGTERYATPFNDPHWPLWAWRFEPDTRARQQW